jgi:DNA-binding transcriptional ArsR family regulator
MVKLKPSALKILKILQSCRRELPLYEIEEIGEFIQGNSIGARLSELKAEGLVNCRQEGDHKVWRAVEISVKDFSSPMQKVLDESRRVLPGYPDGHPQKYEIINQVARLKQKFNLICV